MNSEIQPVQQGRNLLSLGLAVALLVFAGFVYVFSQTSFFSAPSIDRSAPQVQR